MTRGLLITFILFNSFITGCASKQRSENEKKAAIYFTQGTNGLVKADYTYALKNLRQAAKLNPKRSDIFNNLGMAYYFKGKKKTAVKYIKQSIKLDSKNTEAKNNLASIYMEANKLSTARKIYMNTLQDLTYGKHFKTYYNLGILELKRKNERLARKYFKKSIASNAYSCNAHYQLGSFYLKEENFAKAKEHYSQGSDGPCSKSEINSYHLGLVNMKLGNYKQASKDLKIFKARFPKSKYVKAVDRKLASMQIAPETIQTFENAVYSKDGSEIILE